MVFVSRMRVQTLVQAGRTTTFLGLGTCLASSSLSMIHFIFFGVRTESGLGSAIAATFGPWRVVHLAIWLY